MAKDQITLTEIAEGLAENIASSLDLALSGLNKSFEDSVLYAAKISCGGKQVWDIVYDSTLTRKAV